MNTPDTENVVERLTMAITHSVQGEYAKNEAFVREILTSLLTSRDTYWKERVVETIEAQFCIKFPHPNEDYLSGARKMKEIILQALDNLK